MGSSVSVEIPRISADVIRRNRAIFGNKPKDYKDLLQKDPAVQTVYKSMYGNQVGGISGGPLLNNVSNGPAAQDENGRPVAVTYDSEFFKRYDDEETIIKLLFTRDGNSDPLVEKTDEEEMRQTTDTFPIKLYIAEPPEEVKEAAPGLDGKIKMAVNNKLVGLFGLAHAAVQIGDKMVHFLDNHFVKIDQFKAASALLLTNMSKSGRLPKSDKVKQIIAEVIVDWNKHAFYDKALRNCQDFVEDLCDQLNSKCNLSEEHKLGLSFNHNKILRDYLDTLIKHPEKSGFHLLFKNELVEFTTHSELDEWEETNRDQLIPDQLDFLKGFHRAFQLRCAAAELSQNAKLVSRYQANPYAGCTRGNATLI
jgi:hypothetical protein